MLRNALKACREALVARLMWIVCFDGQYADFTSLSSLGRELSIIVVKHIRITSYNSVSCNFRHPSAMSNFQQGPQDLFAEVEPPEAM